MLVKYLVEVDASEYEPFRDALVAFISLALGELEDGVTELTFADAQTAVAYKAADRFLAVRHVDAVGSLEAFFVSPATGRPRLGLAVQSYSGEPPAVPEAFLPFVQAQEETDNLPSFLSLAKLLISRGEEIRAFSEKALQLQSENGYLKQLLAEQSDLYRQARALLRERTHVAPRADDPAPAREACWSLETMPTWCVEHEDEIVVLPRARNGAKKSRYEDPALMGVALEFLAGPYRAHRQGLTSRESFEAALQATGLKLAGAVGATIAGEQGDAYYVPWGGRRRLLDMHLLKGGGRDERYCFRLYFFWDDVSQRAIVGSMPAHLANSLS